MDSEQKMSKGISRYSFYWRHSTYYVGYCRMTLFFGRLLTDDVIMSINEDDVINYIHILYIYTHSVYVRYNIVVAVA